MASPKHAKHHAISLALQSLMLGMAIGVQALPANAQTSTAGNTRAETPASKHNFNIPAGTLGQALNHLAQTAGINLSYENELIEGLQSQGLQGQYTTVDALTVLLEPAGLEAVAQVNGGYTLRNAQTLPAITVSASRSNTGNQLSEVVVTAGAWDGATEGTGSYTQTGPSNTATGLALTLRETPQSVSVMTRQRMDDFKLETLTDVMEQTPGVTIDRQGDANHFMVRGSAVNMQVNGMRQIAAGWAVDAQKFYSMDDMVEIDRIEVLKGSSGLLNGDGNYGATVNMIRKRPTQEFKASMGVGIGSWSNYRADVDLGGPLNASGTVRGRLIAATADGNDFRDNVKRSHQTLFSTVDIDLTPDTLLNVEYTHRRREYRGAGDTSMIQAYNSNGQYLGLKPRSFNVGAPWSGFKQNTNALSANLEHRFTNGWTAKVRASNERTNNPYYETGFWWTVTPEAVDVAWNRKHYNINRSATLNLRGPIELFGRTHEFMLGADVVKAESHAISGSARLTDLGLDYNQGGAAIIRPDMASLPEDNDSTFSSRREAFYAAGHFNLADPVKLIVGARMTNYEQYDITPYASSNKDFHKNGVITPYAGLVVDVHENISVYGSYASIFKPQSSVDSEGKTLAPEEGNTYEVGTKGEFLDKKLNASLAYFWMKTDNVAERTGEARPDGTAIYRAVSGVTRKGYELELSGELAPGWQAQGSYVMNSSSLKSSDNVPKNQFKLASTYQLGGILQGLNVGAAARWQSKTSAGPLEQPSFWVVDLMARYRVNQQLSLNLNVRNAFDKSYFAGMRDFGRVQYTWGAPRSFNVSARYEF